MPVEEITKKENLANAMPQDTEDLKSNPFTNCGVNLVRQTASFWTI